MKIIQANIWLGNKAENLKQFLLDENADIILMQEFPSWILNNWSLDLEKMCSDLWYNLTRWLSFGLLSKDNESIWTQWIAIASKLPVLFKQITYLPILWWYQEFSEDENPFDKSIDRSYQDTLKLRVKSWSIPAPILKVWFMCWDQQISFITTHFKASEKCTNTFLMLRHAEYIASIVKKIDWAVIFWWDLNIYHDAPILEPLREAMTQVTCTQMNTLNPRIHPGFRNDIPSTWLWVDHFFVKWVEVTSFDVYKHVDISDHLPLQLHIK